MRNSKRTVFILAIGLVIVVAVALLYDVLRQRQGEGGSASNTDSKPPVTTEVKDLPQANALKEEYDLVVVGTDPEGVMAAISGARNGLKTLLVDGKDREVLGGLFTLGWLNSLDMNRMPDGKDYYNKGLFKEWFDKIEGDSFDITTATNAFHEMVDAEENIDVRMGIKEIQPITKDVDGTKTVTGVKLVTAENETIEVFSKALIDATQDADIAAAAGVSFTYGREDIGDDELLMAVTPVYTLKNVTPKVWSDIKKALNGDDNVGTGANDQSAWGYGGMWDYESTNPERIRTRGLNLGRQNNETMLVNAIQIFGVDPFDPKSREEAYDIARKELPLMLEYMKEKYPELGPVEIGDLAPELYIRETRHLIGEYRLTIVDLLEQRRHWDEIAFGSYPVDIQSTSPVKTDRGAVLMAPKQYGVPFRTLVPKEIDGLLVVGRTASFDSLPHGSARVVPLGMATAQAAGAAAKLAIENDITFRELSASKEQIAELQKRLTEQGMELDPAKVNPFPFTSHPQYEGLKAAASMDIARGGYANDFMLEDPSKPGRLINNLKNAAKAHKELFSGPFPDAIKDMSEAEQGGPLSLEQAAYTYVLAVYGEGELETSLDKLVADKLVSDATLKTIKNYEELTNGDVYMLMKDIIAAKTGIIY